MFKELIVVREGGGTTVDGFLVKPERGTPIAVEVPDAVRMARQIQDAVHPRLPGPSARPDTLEACWSLIEYMDREVCGAMADEQRWRKRVSELEAMLAKKASD